MLEASAGGTAEVFEPPRKSTRKNHLKNLPMHNKQQGTQEDANSSSRQQAGSRNNSTTSRRWSAMPADRGAPQPLLATVRTNAEVGWCLRELAKRDTNHARKDILAPIQNAAIHYACITAKNQGGSVTTAVKDKRTVEIYKSFAAKGMMEWIVEEADRPLPTWLTVQLMGHSTVTGADEPKLYKSGNTLWGRYRKSAASIRKDFNVIWDEFMVNGKFPPGLGVKDVMENLQHKLYILEQKRKPVKGALETVVEDDGNAEGAAGTAAGGAGAGGASSEGVGAGGMDGKVTAMSGVSTVSAANNEDAEGKGKGPVHNGEAVPNGHEGAEPSEKPVAEGGAPKVTEVSAPKGNEGPGVKVEAPAGGGGEAAPGPVGGPHPELDEDDARIYGGRPDGWVHPASLVFAMYGRPSSREDGDLKMQDGGGLSDRKRKAREMSGGRDGSSVVDVYSSSDMDADGGTGNSRALGGSEEPRSRAKARRENERRQLASESLALQKEVLQHIMNPAGSKHEEALVSSLQAITEVFVGRRALDLEAAGREREAAARARWQQKTDALQAHLKLLQQLGRGQGEEASRVANQLFSHLETAIAVPAIPPTHT